MADSDRYMAQAQAVLQMAGRAGSTAERQVYENIAEGWRKLAGEARRNELRDLGAATKLAIRGDDSAPGGS